MFNITSLCDVINAASVVLLTLVHHVSNTADTALLFKLTSPRNVINAVSVVLRFTVKFLRDISNDADAALLFDCRMNNRTMSILVVC